MAQTTATADELSRLWTTIAARRSAASTDTSYTAQLLAKGPEKCAQKLGEEAVETALAAVQGKRDQTVSESADLLYHWLVLLAALDIDPAEVYAELARRTAQSGLSEKASRQPE